MKKRNLVLMMVMMFIMGFNITVHAANCNVIFGKELIGEIQEVFRIIKIIAPIILLVLTSLDFAKVVFNDNKDGIDKAKNNFLKRSVAVLIIFFAPDIITLIMQLVDDANIQNAAECANQLK